MDPDKLAGVPAGPELGNRGFRRELSGWSTLTLLCHISSLKKWAQTLPA